MRRRPGIHPCLPVPEHERRRLVTLAHIAFAELQAGDPAQALVDLHAVALVAAELLAGDRFSEDARQAALEAAGAIAAARAGTTPCAAAIAPAMAAVELLEAALPLVTWRRLEAAKVAAMR